MNFIYLKICCCFLLIYVITGCATWAQHGVIPSPQQKFKIAILPIQTSVDIKKLSDIQTVSSVVPDEKEMIKEQLRKVSAQLTQSLRTHLNGTTYFEVIPALQADAETNPQEVFVQQSWSVVELRKLAPEPETQAVLFVTLSGYGKIKKKWQAYLIGTGVVEGVVQGVVVARAVNAAWAGVVVGLEEVIQEVLVWGGGTYLFNWSYAPVTIEARLISVSDAKVVWKDTVFVSVDKKGIKMLSKEDRNKKEIQLLLTAEKAIKELSQDIGKAGKRNLHDR